MQQELIEWYVKNKRNLPFRDINDPYKIWISEIMLQQTTVKAVIPYYLRFIELFPDVYTLAKASLDDVYKAWEGLGYYRRAKHIHESALMIVNKFHGEFPKTYKDLLSLKGIGAYTASSISSFAYKAPYAAIDGNALRVLSRVYRIHENIALNKTVKSITELGNTLIKHYPSDLFNQGLMDLANAICKVKNPDCLHCPLKQVCMAYKYHEEKILPINIKKIKKSDHRYITGIIYYQDKYLLIKRDSGLLEHMFGFVQYEINDPYEFIECFSKEFHKKLELIENIKDFKHVFTHQNWYMSVYLFKLENDIDSLFTIKEIENLSIPTAHKKIWTFYQKNLFSKI